jgi:hypothetical protein
MLQNGRLNKRRGMVFYLVLSVVVIMGIFIGFYHSFSRQLAFSSFHHANRERLRNLSDVILDSAFANIQYETRDPDSDISRKIIAQMRSSSIDGSYFDVPAPLFEEYKSDLLLGATFEYSLGARVFDKRIENPRGHKYHDGEGLGTLELQLNATLKSGSKVLVSCLRRRQYDFKSACLVSSSEQRENSYAMSFPLDFALLVRDGLREFSEGYRGQALNSGQKLVLKDQSAYSDDRRGLLYFGNADTNSDAKRIYLNTTDAETDLLPSITGNRFEIDQDECIRLIPAADTGGTYRGLKGVFTTRVMPAAAAASGNEKEDLTRFHLEILQNNSRLPAAPAGLVIEGDKSRAYLESFVRGAVTQRFLYYSEFSFDTSNMETAAGDPIPEEGKQKIRDSIKGFISLDPSCPYLSSSSIPDSQAKQTRKIHAAKIQAIMNRLNPPISLHSKLVEEALYFKGQTLSKTITPEEFPAPPKFFARDGSLLSSINQTGGEGFRPFRHCTLWTTRFLRAEDLEKSGILDRKDGVLNLRGIISVELDPVVLSAPSGRSLVVKGQGALLAPYGFTIQSGIKRDNPDKDLCILFTRKANINIVTNEPIEASLLAFNDSNNASIVPSKPFKVVGSVGVDRLSLNRYPAATSQIEYDPRLRVKAKDEEVFALTISPWVRFENISFSKD